MKPDDRLTGREAAELIGISYNVWRWYGRSDVAVRPPADGVFGVQPYWLRSTIERVAPELRARRYVKHAEVIAALATPGLPDSPAGRAAVAADLGVHPRTVARHAASHASGTCAC